MKKCFLIFLLISSCGILSFSAPTIGGPTIGPSSSGTNSGSGGSSTSSINATNLYLGAASSGIYLVNSNFTTYATNTAYTDTNSLTISGSSDSDGVWYYNASKKSYTNASYSGFGIYWDYADSYGFGSQSQFMTNAAHPDIPGDFLNYNDFSTPSGNGYVWANSSAAPNGTIVNAAVIRYRINFNGAFSGNGDALSNTNFSGTTNTFAATNDLFYTKHWNGSAYEPGQLSLYNLFAKSNTWVSVGDYFSFKTIGNSDPGQILMSSTVHATGHGVVWLGANSGDIVIGPSPSHGIFQMGSTGIGGSELYITYEAGATAIAGKTWSHPLSFRAQAWNGSSAVDCFASIVAMASAAGSAANAGNAEFVFYSTRPYWAFANTNILAPNTAGTEVFRVGTNGAVLNWGYVYKGNGSGLTNLSTSSFTGVTDGSSASAGSVGEYISSLVAVGSAKDFNSLATTNVTSISLTAGDWDVEGHINFTFSGAVATILKISGGITTTTATIPTDGTEVTASESVSESNVPNSITLDRKRINVSSTTTVYLVAGSDAAASTTIKAYGGITARRMR